LEVLIKIIVFYLITMLIFFITARYLHSFSKFVLSFFLNKFIHILLLYRFIRIYNFTLIYMVKDERKSIYNELFIYIETCNYNNGYFY